MNREGSPARTSYDSNDKRYSYFNGTKNSPNGPDINLRASSSSP